MTTIITFQESNYTDSGYFYRCPGHHFDDLSNEYVPLAEYEALQAENERLRSALQQIAAGNPAPPGGKWLSDAKMAQIAREALGEAPLSVIEG